ncbi:hypothetical protein FA15DRAFT_624011 [Coprinopsis marcescibilis]|uniref:Uncharacterized protein n=1 Tax=Coprinopsis marcescibilis TaxID=230819 RepID=A0A5C3KMA2_COPMA|nr:hypothetical protein FA15DRAFT_624011 [Coprinopsis marcescibilis]
MSTLSDDELGMAFGEVMYVNIMLSLLDVGIQLFMFLYGLSVYLESPASLRKGRSPYIFLSFIIFAMACISGTIDCAFLFKVFMASTSPYDFLVQFIELDGTPVRFTSEVMFTIVVFIGDGLLLYRCFIIWSDKRLVIILPTLTYLAGVGMGIDSLIPASSMSTRASRVAWIFLLVSTNIIITALISFRLLRARSRLAKLLPDRTNTLDTYSGVIAILIESAAPLSIFGLAFASNMIYSFNNATIPSELAQYILAGLFYSFTALSPQMIIFRVTTGRSWLSNPNFHNASGDSILSKPIVFAQHTPAEQSFLIATQPGTGESSSVEGENSDGGSVELRQRTTAHAHLTSAPETVEIQTSDRPTGEKAV